MIHKGQLTDLIERTLTEYQLCSPNAIRLVYGTIAHESTVAGKTCLRQRPRGKFNIKKHALGIVQMEWNTFKWLCDKFGEKYSFSESDFTRLEYDLKFAILLCRLRYRAVSSPLPDTLEGLAQYYKTYYNSSAGAATPEDFIEAFNRD